jgi:hypothetical protein
MSALIQILRLLVSRPQYQYMSEVKAIAQALITPMEKGTGSNWLREWIGFISDVDKMANETPIIGS